MMDDATKTWLADMLYLPLRQAPGNRGRGDPEVKTLAVKLVEHLERCGMTGIARRNGAGWGGPPAGEAFQATLPRCEKLDGSTLRIVPGNIEAGQFCEANCVTVTDGERSAVYVPLATSASR